MVSSSWFLAGGGGGGQGVMNLYRVTPLVTHTSISMKVPHQSCSHSCLYIAVFSRFILTLSLVCNIGCLMSVSKTTCRPIQVLPCGRLVTLPVWVVTCRNVSLSCHNVSSPYSASPAGCISQRLTTVAMVTPSCLLGACSLHPASVCVCVCVCVGQSLEKYSPKLAHPPRPVCEELQRFRQQRVKTGYAVSVQSLSRLSLTCVIGIIW